MFTSLKLCIITPLGKCEAAEQNSKVNEQPNNGITSKGSSCLCKSCARRSWHHVKRRSKFHFFPLIIFFTGSWSQRSLPTSNAYRGKSALWTRLCPLLICYARLGNIQSRCKTILIIIRGKKNPSMCILGWGINTFPDILTTIVFMPHASGGCVHKFT